MRVAWALALIAACSSPSLTAVLPPLPESIDRVAVLFTAEDRRVIGATALLARQDPLHTSLPDDLDERDVRGVWVIGHDPGSLAPRLRPEESTLATRRLSAAGPDDRALPPPAFAAFSDRQLGIFDLAVSAQAPPALTVDWLSRCPILLPSGEGLVDITCKEIPCLALAEQIGCTVRVDASRCTYGKADITLDSSGRPTVARDTQLGTCAVASEAPSGTTLALVCDLGSARQCPIDLYPATNAPLSFTTLPLGTAAIDRPSLGHPPEGFVPSIAAFGDEVVTATLSDATIPSMCSGVFARLAFVGGETVRWANAPRCLVHLATDPTSEAHFFGIFRDPSWTLGRFDATGALTATRALGLAADARVIALEVDLPAAPAPEVAVLTGDALIFFDARTLSLRTTIALTGLEPRAVSLRSTVAGVADDLSDALHEVNRSSGTRIAFNLKGNNSTEKLGAMISLGSDWIVTATARIGGIRILSPGSEVRVARPYEGFIQPYGIAPWPGDPGLLLVGLTEIFDAGAGFTSDPTSKNAYLALFDPAGTRFLPGLTEVGIGPVTRIITDRRGRAWATLPWTATVLRVGK